jgi:hypothetical protein
MSALERRSALLLALLIAVCPSAEPEPEPEPPTPPVLSDDDDAVDDDDDSTQAACEPALSLDPSEAWVLPSSGLVALAASGGTGAFSFALSTDSSGGQVHPEYGTYLPGAGSGVDDVVTVTDAGCLGEASATLHVVAPMQVSPTSVDASPGTSFEVAVAAGSGAWACTLIANGTGATLSSPCTYEGGGEGIDALRVEDLATGQTVDVRVELRNGAVLRADPPRVWIPTGGTWALRVKGGSGYVTATATSGSAVTWAEGRFSALAPGPTVFDLVDDFTGQATSVTVTGVPPVEGGFPRAGDNYLSGDSSSPGDLNGDGWADVVLGISEADFGTYNNGAVHVFAGQEGGLQPEPVQTLTGREYDDRFGETLHVADVTGDGELDLLVGTWLSDIAGTNSGLVELFPGIPGGFFAPTPSQTWSGDQPDDYFGAGLTTCDFNGDGYRDLAVGASADEDRTVPEVEFSQGGVWFFLGGPTGLAGVASQKVYGSVPDGSGGWMYADEVRLGSELEAGDVNGDGLCDLVAGAWEFEPPGENGNDGAVFVYLGTSTNGSSAAVYGQPVVAWSATEPDSRDSYFGRELDVGDVDDDGKADILVGQHRHRVPGVSGDRHGAARLYLGEAWTASPAPDFTPVTAAAWSLFGDGSYDALGWEVRLREMTGDGVMDLLIGGHSDEVPGGVNGTGLVMTFPGVPGGLPADVPSAWFGGDLAGDLFGVRVEGLPDMDGDGADDLFVYASRAEHHGIHVGTPFFKPTGLGAPAVPLGNPGESAGQRAGESVAVLGDVNGDGFEDVAVGVPQYDNAGNQINAGLVQIFFGTATGVADTAWELTGFTGYSDSDYWGWSVSPAGDFDGDGIADLAIVGRYEDRPSSFSSAYAGTPSCAGSIINSGAVAVFRGTASGLPESQPSFVWYGRESFDSTQRLAGGFDLDGDGYGDLLAGGTDWDTTIGNVGGFEILRGRPADPGGIVVICDGELFEGAENTGNLGRGLTGLGDLDNDGCDEAAIGAYNEDLGYSNQGVVRVLWGFGPVCNESAPHVSLLTPLDSNARAGFSLAGGDDVDGDGINDLVVGGYSRSTNGNSTGAAWLVPGWYLQGLPREGLTTAVLATGASPLTPPSGGPYAVIGTLQDEQVGYAVAMVPGIGGADRRGPDPPVGSRARRPRSCAVGRVRRRVVHPERPGRRGRVGRRDRGAARAGRGRLPGGQLGPCPGRRLGRAPDALSAPR